MRRLLVAVVVFVFALADVSRGQPRRSGEPRLAQAPVPADRIPRLEQWLKAVDRHDPGEDDEATEQVGEWSLAELRGLWVDINVLGQLMRNPKLSHFVVKAENQSNGTAIAYSGEQVRQMAALACTAAGMLVSNPDCVAMKAAASIDDELRELAARASAERLRTGDDNYLLRRAALLHADIAMLQPHAALEPFAATRSEIGPQSWRVDILDGRGTGAGLTAIHWDIARLALDQVRPRGANRPAPERDAMVRAWYRATAAWMQWREDHDTLHLDRGRKMFPSDPDLLFLSGCQHETYASAAIQTAARSVVLPPGLTVGIESERSELRQAETFFRGALAIRPDMGEARLRLGRVLGLIGHHDEAAAELQQALMAVTDDTLRYFGELFVGAEEEAVGRFDAAADAYRRAAELFPVAQSPHVALSHLAHRRGDRAGAAAAMNRVFDLPTEVDDRGDDPWWRYHVAQARDAEDLLAALREPFRRAAGK